MTSDYLKLPKNDEELGQLLKSLGRNKEQIEAIKDFGRLSKALVGSGQELEKTITDLNHKYIVKEKKGCFGYYDDGDAECGQCEDGDACFEKGVV